MCLTNDVVYTDFSEAFDRGNHNLLFFEFQFSGFPSHLLKLISSYLQNRSFRVLLNDVLLNEFPVNSVVPQGSHLVHFLFILYITDLPSVIKSSCALT